MSTVNKWFNQLQHDDTSVSDDKGLKKAAIKDTVTNVSDFMLADRRLTVHDILRQYTPQKVYTPREMVRDASRVCPLQITNANISLRFNNVWRSPKECSWHSIIPQDLTSCNFFLFPSLISFVKQKF